MTSSHLNIADLRWVDHIFCLVWGPSSLFIVLHPLLLEDDECLASHDVVSLFTNTPIDMTLDIIRDKLAKDPNLNQRTNNPENNRWSCVISCLLPGYLEADCFIKITFQSTQDGNFRRYQVFDEKTKWWTSSKKSLDGFSSKLGGGHSHWGGVAYVWLLRPQFSAPLSPYFYWKWMAPTQGLPIFSFDLSPKASYFSISTEINYFKRFCAQSSF